MTSSAAPRDRSRPRLGVVLSSGGVRGVYAHAGLLLALDALGLRPRALAGCSAGAVTGGIVASGTPIHQWWDALSGVRPERFWRPAWPRVLWSLLARRGRGLTGLSDTAGAQAFCLEHMQARTFEGCSMPFHALAVHLASGRKHVFRHGPLAPAMLASAAMPVLYEPVEIDGELYCDGALIELAPVDAICCQYGLDVLIVHHAGQRDEGRAGLARAMRQPWTLLEIIGMLLYQRRPWYLTGEPVSLRRCPCGCGAAVIVLEPDLPPMPWPVTTHGTDVGESARAQAEAALRPLLPRITGREPFPEDAFATSLPPWGEAVATTCDTREARRHGA